MAKADPKPGPDPVTGQLRKLYHEIKHLIALHEAINAPRTIVDGDIEIPWSQGSKDIIAARIAAKTAAIAQKVAALKHGE